jgi:predicted ATP-grasp superfamily ATP-dependent carboligase
MSMGPSTRAVLVVRLGSEYGLDLLVARCLAQWRGTQVYLLTADGESIARYSRHVRSLCSPKSTDAGDAWGDILNRAAKRTAADVILPADQPAVRLLTAHRNDLPATAQLAPMPSLVSLDQADDKHAFAQLLQELKLPLPRTIPVTRDAGFSKALRSFSFPALLKPTRRSGGRGIREFATADALVEHVMSGSPGEEPHIVQEFVNGDDLSCNVLCEHGRIVAHTLQRGFLPPAEPFGMPSGVEFFHHEDTMGSIRQLVAALDWNGVANIDLRFSEARGRALILEFNPRFWGSLLASAFVGVNFPEMACRLALGLECPAAGFRPGRFIVHKRAALRHLPGMLRRRRSPTALPQGSILSHVAGDPLPEIALLLRRFRRRLLCQP